MSPIFAPFIGAAFGVLVYWYWHDAIRAFVRRWEGKPPIRTYDVATPVSRVENAYVRGDIADEDLDWCITLALKPPEPMPRQIHEEALRDAMQARVVLGPAARVVPLPTSSQVWSAAPPGTHVIPWTAAEIPEDETEPINLYDANGEVQSIVRKRKAFADDEWKRLRAD